MLQGLKVYSYFTLQAMDIGQLVIEEGPIMIHCYASLSSLIFNQSYLGYNRDRNGISF